MLNGFSVGNAQISGVTAWNNHCTALQSECRSRKKGQGICL